MKKFYIIIWIFSLIFASVINAQDSTVIQNAAVAVVPVVVQQPPTEYQKASMVNDALEYNTLAFNDLKQKWVISDPILIREIFNRFVVRDALRSNGSKVTLQAVKEKTEEIYNGTVAIDLRRRYYDDEMEFFAFIPESQMQKSNPQYMFDPVKDPFLLREIVGEKVYEKIRTQGYFFSNITKVSYDTKNGYLFDLNMDVLDGRIMYWNTTSSGRNKYLISLFGKWGVDEIMQPGWYSGEYIVGSGLTYYQSISNDTRNYLYDIRVGTVLQAGRPFLGGVTKNHLLQPTGQSVYFKASGDVIKYIMDGADGYYLNIEAKYTIDEKKNREFNFDIKDTIYSVRNYAVLSVSKRDLANFGDIGNLKVSWGISTSDIYRYEVTKTTSKMLDLDKKKDFILKFVHSVFAEVGVLRSGGLIQHDVSFMLNANTDGFGVLGVKAIFMLSDQFGLDMRIMKGFGWDAKKLPYRTDSYMVFSPILRINY